MPDEQLRLSVHVSRLQEHRQAWDCHSYCKICGGRGKIEFRAITGIFLCCTVDAVLCT